MATYGYDPFNRRLWKETGGQRTWYLYSKEGLIGEYIADSGTPPVELKTYGYLPGSSWTTNPLFQKVGEEYFWYLNDHLGTPRMMVDSNGETRWSADYEAYGKATVATGTITNNIRFPGQYYDAESGLHWNFNRYYDPVTGRYVGVDPIGQAGGMNLYGYVGVNPVNLLDSEGLEVARYGRPANLPWPLNMVEHHWLKTDSNEAGMGERQGQIPGQGNSGLPGVQTQTIDHTGQSNARNAHKIPIPFPVREECIDYRIRAGQNTGRWGPTNNCQSFVNETLNACRDTWRDENDFINTINNR